jgi:hypothetical protein
MDNELHKLCPMCRSADVRTWFDEPEIEEDTIMEDEDDD